MSKWPPLPAAGLPEIRCKCKRVFRSELAFEVHIATAPKDEEHWEVGK